MNKIIFKFGEVSFTVDEVSEGLYDLNHLRKQVDDFKKSTEGVELTKRTSNQEMIRISSKFSSTQTMSDWGKYLQKELKEVYQYSSKRGRGACTLANKKGLVAYASWLNDDFRFALEAAFVALSEGRDQDAREIVGESIIDLEFADKVSSRWKEYVKWSYSSFQEVNNRYGANLTRMVIKSATGASTKNNIQGKADDGLIERLVTQGNGAAILAINTTLDIVKNAMKTSVFKLMMETRDGQKEAYKTLSELLDWSE